ncbi:Quinol monooxygenase YgiN [Pseudomonas sp. NFACC02]|uniref:antibiotic biosynthesis monooxygenase n=1 Tax=Pseudomonas sp. NFACC02 TaxID=1566250 RepID=UPI0008B7BC98|nr:antibiotic biosynthesis monooxygenase [Pseudomonas sp. NFACC02]SEP67422.1 Quinol monooxygenase YgiN [Pseudomonas sp. NFACC02]
MLVSAINTVEIHATQGRSSEVGTRVPRMLEVLNSTTPCVAYTFTASKHDDASWIVSGYWRSEGQMQAHFSHPELTGFMELLSSGAISHIQFNSFVIDANEVT